MSQRASVAPDTSTAEKSLSFSGHETFVFRHGWLKKSFDAVRRDAKIFSSEDAPVVLGVGKNMVQSMKHWALATNVLRLANTGKTNELVPSAMGKLLFEEYDPHLEDPSSLWLLHWNLLRSRERCTTWTWAFDKVPSNDFSKDSLLRVVQSELRSSSARMPSEGALRRDIDVFVRTYVPARGAKSRLSEDTLDCPLSELRLIEEGSAGHYRFRREDKADLEPAVFVYCICDFWSQSAPHQNTLSLAALTYGTGSPGSVFKLNESTMISRLEDVEHFTNGALVYEETSGIRQLQKHTEIDREHLLRAYYASAIETAGVL